MAKKKKNRHHRSSNINGVAAATANTATHRKKISAENSASTWRRKYQYGGVISPSLSGGIVARVCARQQNGGEGMQSRGEGNHQ